MKRRQIAGNVPRLSIRQPLISSRRSTQYEKAGSRSSTPDVDRGELLELTLEQLQDGLIVCDRHGKIALSNAAARKLAIDEPQGHSILLTSSVWGKLLGPPGRTRSIRESPCVKALQGQTITCREYCLVRAKGACTHLSINANPITSRFGLIGAAVCIRDISQLKREERVARNLARENERARIAAEIHDTLSQDLNALVLQLEAAQGLWDQSLTNAASHVRRAKHLAKSALSKVRRSIWSAALNVSELQNPASALRILVNRLFEGSSIKVEVSVPRAHKALSPVVHFELLRIAREALLNVIKHAGARNVDIRLKYLVDEVQLRIYDDGHGFTPAVFNGGRSGFGLISMRERAEQLGGKLIVASRMGKGTKVIVRLPVRVSEANRAAA